MSRQAERAEPPEVEMQKIESVQRPWEGQQDVDQGRRIERERVPLRQERDPGEVVGVPQGDFAGAIALLNVPGQWITEIGEVAREKTAPAENHVREGSQQQDPQQKRE